MNRLSPVSMAGFAMATGLFLSSNANAAGITVSNNIHAANAAARLTSDQTCLTHDIGFGSRNECTRAVRTGLGVPFTYQMYGDAGSLRSFDVWLEGYNAGGTVSCTVLSYEYDGRLLGSAMVSTATAGAFEFYAPIPLSQISYWGTISAECNIPYMSTFRQVITYMVYDGP